MKQEVFVRAYQVVKPIVLKAYRQYYIQLWDLADMEQEGMITLHQLLTRFPELGDDDDKLRRYFKTKFRNRLNDEVRRQDSVKRQFDKMEYVEISEVGYLIPDNSIDVVDKLGYEEQLGKYRKTLSVAQHSNLELLLAGERFKGRKKMIKEMKVWLVDFDPYEEED